MKKISFVILHYMAINDTIECIDSIFNNLKSSECEVSAVVVDNNSPDDSYEKLVKKYDGAKDLYFIHNEENLGFAKGNNVGFQYAKTNLDPDFILLINNDTYITQKDFCKVLIEDYENSRFDIAGPNIIALRNDSLNQNPLPYDPMTVERIDKIIFRYKVNKFACYFNCDKYVNKIRRKHNGKPGEKKDFKLHGSCLIFSKDYIQKYDGLYSETFMYYEEDILKFISIRDNLKMVFLDNITIYHKEDASTDVVFKKAKSKRLFFYKWSIDSLKKLKKLVIENDRKGK